MMTTKTTKVKNGTLTLPKELRKAWKEAEVFIFPSEDTLIVKKIQKPLEIDWKKYEEKLSKGRKRISPKIINEATKWAKIQS